MTPILYINCTDVPYVDEIIAHRKRYETRSRNTLRRLAGKRVLIAETGNGQPLVRCSAYIGTKPIKITSGDDWEWYRSAHRVPKGSAYDWTPGTDVKWLYELIDVRPVKPFYPVTGIRHGRVWAEFDEASGWKILQNA